MAIDPRSSLRPPQIAGGSVYTAICGQVRQRRVADKRGSSGSVLVLALWSLCLLAAFAVSMGYMVRQKLTLLDRIERRQMLWDAAWAAIETARSTVKEDVDLTTDSYADRWAGDPTAFRNVRFGRARYSVRSERSLANRRETVYGLSDEQGKLNLNVAAPQAISLLIQQISLMGADEADSLAYAIVDWRDGDSAYGHPDKGAEDSDYGDLPKPYGAKDAPYESPDELFLVNGMNHDIVEKMTPFVTVFGSGIVNLNTAPREVLVALGLPMSAADKLIRCREGRIFTNISMVVKEIESSGAELNEIERAAVENLAGSGTAGVVTGTFGVSVLAETDDGRAEMAVEAVLNRDASVIFCRTPGFRWRSRSGA